MVFKTLLRTLWFLVFWALFGLHRCVLEGCAVERFGRFSVFPAWLFSGCSFSPHVFAEKG